MLYVSSTRTLFFCYPAHAPTHPSGAVGARENNERLLSPRPHPKEGK